MTATGSGNSTAELADECARAAIVYAALDALPFDTYPEPE